MARLRFPRPPELRIHADELIVDSFAGGGGASTGIEMALGRSPDIAINHDAEAIAMHERNHPRTRHLHGDIWDVDPRAACEGKRVGLAWFSPDCKHFSKAKGGKPVEKNIRGLAWVVIRWAREVRPRVIILENVEEFQTWGPLGDDNRPDPARRGHTFKRWRAQLTNLGYRVETKELRACDYGAPTTRKRLFIIARCDGEPIAWPEPTHGKGRALAYRTAAECIEWSTPVLSIFASKDDARAFAKRHDLDGAPQRPLAEKTLARIARGVQRFVLDAATPFIVPLTHARLNDSAPHSVHAPVRTITGAHRGELAFVSPTLIQTGYGERRGQAPRSLDLHEPLGTVVAGGAKHALVAAFLAKHNGGHEATGSSLRAPSSTITARDHHSLVTSHMVKRDTCEGGLHLGEVRAFLTKYYGSGTGQAVTTPMGTVVTRDRLGLVTVLGEDYAIADIGMRMLQPRELFRAQGFHESYGIDSDSRGGALTKTAQIRLCGNSVCPPLAAALVSANLVDSSAIAA